MRRCETNPHLWINLCNPATVIPFSKLQACLDATDRSGVRKVSGLLWIPVYRSIIQSARLPSPENRPDYCKFWYIGIWYIEIYLYIIPLSGFLDTLLRSPWRLLVCTIHRESTSNAFGMRQCIFCLCCTNKQYSRWPNQCTSWNKHNGQGIPKMIDFCYRRQYVRDACEAYSHL